MSGLEVAGLIIGIAGLVTVLREAHTLVKKHQERSLIRRVGLGSTASLARALDSGQLTLSSRYYGFRSAYGSPFEQGDEIAIRQLEQLLSQFERGLTAALKSAQLAGRINHPSDLVRVTITGRADSLRSLTDLAQRIAATQSIRAPSTYQSLRHPRQISYSNTSDSLGLPSTYGPLRRASQYKSVGELPRRRVRGRSRLTPSTTYNSSSGGSHSFQFSIDFPDTATNSFDDAQQPVGRNLSLLEQLINMRQEPVDMGPLGCDLCHRKFQKAHSLEQHRRSKGHLARERGEM
ncbi:hypothetical protein BKA64DRAFT_143686 [Cadophora sp. MPI-SDFR-AT-0126]|nr:hypothetical protein BKA64DRAFT_143686 [Leotiomycetes sp. MPI-SDFR-AT-0126]